MIAGEDPRGKWFQTFGGTKFHYFDPRPEDIDITDIAHALANECRFGGHTRGFYSVAQHAILVSQVVPEEHALWGLLHDASEAYFKDLPRGLKHCPELEFYRTAERRCMEVIAARFGLSWPEPAEVKAADLRVCDTEIRDLLVPGHAYVARPRDPLDVLIIANDYHEGVRREFLERFNWLMMQRRAREGT